MIFMMMVFPHFLFLVRFVSITHSFFYFLFFIPLFILFFVPLLVLLFILLFVPLLILPLIKNLLMGFS